MAEVVYCALPGPVLEQKWLKSVFFEIVFLFTFNILCDKNLNIPIFLLHTGPPKLKERVAFVAILFFGILHLLGLSTLMAERGEDRN